MLPEVLQVLRGAGKVGSALVTTQGEQLRLMACNSTLGAGVKGAQEVVEGLMSTFMAKSNVVRMLGTPLAIDRIFIAGNKQLKWVVYICVFHFSRLCNSSQRTRTCFLMLKVGRMWMLRM